MQRLMILSVMAACGCSTAAGTNSTPEPTESAMSQPAKQKQSNGTIDDANAEFLASFEAGKPDQAVAHFSDDAVWYLTNGTPIAGRAAIGGFLAKAGADGAGNFEFTERAVREVGEARYSTEKFAFDLAPGKTVRGTRYGLWSVSSGSPVLVRDAWASETPAAAPVVSALAERTELLATTYNGGDATALNGFYADDATLVLSNGIVISGDALRPMLTDTAKMGIDDMRFGPQTVMAAGEGAAYSIGSFDVTLPTPDGAVPLSGERLILWRRGESGEWNVALEMSWPRASSGR